MLDPGDFYPWQKAYYTGYIDYTKHASKLVSLVEKALGQYEHRVNHTTFALETSAVYEFARDIALGFQHPHPVKYVILEFDPDADPLGLGIGGFQYSSIINVISSILTMFSTYVVHNSSFELAFQQLGDQLFVHVYPKWPLSLDKEKLLKLKEKLLKLFSEEKTNDLKHRGFHVLVVPKSLRDWEGYTNDFKPWLLQMGAVFYDVDEILPKNRSKFIEKLTKDKIVIDFDL